MCVCSLLCTHLYTRQGCLCTSAMSVEARRGYQIPLSWSYSNCHLPDVGAENQGWIVFQKPGHVITH